MRYFPNRLPDFKKAERVEVDAEFWKQKVLYTAGEIIKEMPPTFDNCDGGLYVGCAGVAYMFYYLSQCERFQDVKGDLLTKARNYIDVALSYAQSKHSRDPKSSFLLGGTGVYAVGALIYEDVGEKKVAQDLIKKYSSLAASCLPVTYLKHGSDELFVGRAGYLCGALLLNRKFGKVINESQDLHQVCHAIITSGHDYSKRHNSTSPLMFAYYNTEYLGAAHGLSSILQMLLCFPTFLQSDKKTEAMVRGSVDYMLSVLQTNGNIAPATDEVGKRQRPQGEELVHWCHGGPGVVYLFVKAFLLWKDDRYLQAALKCGELVWQYGLLRKGSGICHGVAGSGYVFLLLYRLTSDERHYHRALQFGQFLFAEEFSEARVPDRPYSLYEGSAGTACFMADLTQPQKAEFPLFDVFSY